MRNYFPKYIVQKFAYLKPEEILKEEKIMILSIIKYLQTESAGGVKVDKRDYELVLKSNTRLVDENRMLKRDIKIIAEYLKYQKFLDNETVRGIIEYYTKQKELDN